MGVTRIQYVACGNCGASFEAELADSVNATRFPATRSKIISGEFHRVRCPHCGIWVTVEKAFNYMDLNRSTIFAVHPRQERYTWEDKSARLDKDVAKIPDNLASGDLHVRVVFGMAELREKLIAQDAGLDDRDVEMIKALIAYEHPVLLERPRLRLHLTSTSPASLEFRAGYDHDGLSFKVTVPTALTDALREGKTLPRWSSRAHGGAAIYEDDRTHWVNMWRWSPANWALAELKRCADALNAHEEINLRSHAVERMTEYLPRGSHLPNWAKRALRELLEYARRHGEAALQDALFEIRFDRSLEDDWSLNNDPDDIPTLWDLLKDLPDTHVEGNIKLNELVLAEGERGGWYEPWSGDIHIGSGLLSSGEKLQDVVRHEVGHAVHEDNLEAVNDWLNSRFGWRSYSADQAGVDAWVADMGGWGSVSPPHQAEIRQLLVSALGPGQRWVPGPPPNPPSSHPWWSPTFEPRLAYEKTGREWFGRHQDWHRHGDRAFFMNFWYRAFMVVDVAALRLVESMPSNYAAMSHFEYFAELYALYYDVDDPMRSNIPADVVDWFAGELGPAGIGMPARR